LSSWGEVSIKLTAQKRDAEQLPDIIMRLACHLESSIPQLNEVEVNGQTQALVLFGNKKNQNWFEFL